ncbi:MAG TPA: hypothetical protein ENI87_10385 [bacterium]|nr:hypothetical protein [bacterium]
MSRLPLLLATAAGFASIASAQEPSLKEQVDEILERLDEIEDTQAETAEKVGGRAVVQAFNAAQLDIGGHVSSLFTHMEGERGTDTGHVVSLIELFVKAKIDDEWSLFAAPGFYTFNGALLDNPATPTVAGDPTFTADTAAVENLFVSRIYGEWRPSDLLQVQAGVVGSPHGPSNREYFIPSRNIAQANLHNRVFLANQLYPQNLRGVKSSGKYMIGDTDWIDYDAYIGVSGTAAGDSLGGARLGYTFGDSGLSIALNYGRGTRTGSATPSTNFPALQSPFLSTRNMTRDYSFGGLDVDWRQGPYVFKGEAYYSGEKNMRDQKAFSGEFTYFVTPAWGLTYRYDYYSAGSDLNVLLPTPAVVPLGFSTEHVVGISYNPSPSVRLRLDIHHNNLPNTSDTVDYVNVSWSLSF